VEREMKIWELDELEKTVCPIHGLDSNGDIDFTAVATESERQAAQALVAEYLPQLEV
jgi:hypothetical protein